MTQLLQSNAILNIRGELDDLANSKLVSAFNKLEGLQDGTNLTFRIPQMRIVASTLVMYRNEKSLTVVTDYDLTDPVGGVLVYINAPSLTDTQAATFYFNWFTDIEYDHFLSRAANELGFDVYYTGSADTPGVEPVLDDNGNPITVTDFESGLKAALIYLAAGHACKALAARLAVKYDITYGDHSLSPSSMSKQYADMAKDFTVRGNTARDDFYKGQGRQYRPAIATSGYFLPDVTPKR